MARSPSSPALLRATISKRGTRPIRAPIVSACLIHLIACLVLPLIEPSGRPIRSAATTAPTITTSTRTTNHDRPSCLPPRIDDAQHRGDGTTRLDRPVIHWPPTHWPQTHRPPITGRPRCTPGVVSPPDPVRRRSVPSVGQFHRSDSAISRSVPSWDQSHRGCRSQVRATAVAVSPTPNRRPAETVPLRRNTVARTSAHVITRGKTPGMPPISTRTPIAGRNPADTAAA